MGRKQNVNKQKGEKIKKSKLKRGNQNERR